MLDPCRISDSFSSVENLLPGQAQAPRDLGEIWISGIRISTFTGCFGVLYFVLIRLDRRMDRNAGFLFLINVRVMLFG